MNRSFDLFDRPKDVDATFRSFAALSKRVDRGITEESCVRFCSLEDRSVYQVYFHQKLPLSEQQAILEEDNPHWKQDCLLQILSRVCIVLQTLDVPYACIIESAM